MFAFYFLYLFCLNQVLSDSVSDNSYESVMPSTISSLRYPILETEGNLLDDFEETTETTTKPSETTTVLTALQHYQRNWCERMLRTSGPKTIPESMNVTEFEEKYVIPGYRALWHRSCYLPHRTANVASYVSGRVMDIANSMVQRIVGTANTAFDPDSDVIRDMLVRPTPQ